jgi:hypothetical protein
MKSKFHYIEAPNQVPMILFDWYKTIFLGGSITGSWDWQTHATAKLKDHFNIFNPRRAKFDVNDKGVELEQITWEYQGLRSCPILLFYFSHETLAPITLFEYGGALERLKTVSYLKIYCAIHPEYKRKNDVIIQTNLIAPQIMRNLSLDLDQTIEKIIKENGS